MSGEQPTMADVIADSLAEWPAEDSAEEHAVRVAAALSAAGFGPVRDSAAAGILSVTDVWGSGGRATVRLSELSEIAKDVREGEWDSHLEWNLKDIARRAKISGHAETEDAEP